MIRQTNKKSVRLTHSKEMADIIGIPPHWIIKQGSLLLLLIFLLAAAASYFVPYPEYITTDIHFSYPSAMGVSAHFLIPNEKAKKITLLRKTDIHFISPPGPYPAFATGRIMQISASREPGFSVATIVFTDNPDGSQFKTVVTKKDSIAKAVITTGTIPLLFVIFQKNSQ